MESNLFLVIESGGTKSTWVFGRSESDFQTIETVGLHPQELISEKQEIIRSIVQKYNLEGASTYFFGAGCESETAREKIRNFLTKVSITCKEINTDLLAACRAMLGKKSGVVGILGTGAIVAQFDGAKIVKKTSGLGYMLGDEGSGYDLGRRLLRSYFNDKLPKEIKNEVNEYFEHQPILHRIYAPDGRRLVAGLTVIIHRWRAEPSILEIIYASFSDFCTTALAPLSLEPKQTVHFIGSIAFHFTKELQHCLTEHGYMLGECSKVAVHEVFNYLIDENQRLIG